jgi:hypothetical protein
MPDEKKVPDTIDKIQQRANELCEAVQNEDDEKKLEDLYHEFSINNTRKNVVRLNELNKLLDEVNDQAYKRFKNNPAEMSNKDVLDYMNAVQSQIERSEKTVNGLKEINATQINNSTTNVQINVGGESTAMPNQASRDRIADAINEILKGLSKPDNKDAIEAEVTDKEN